MTEKFQRLRDSATESALATKAYLFTFFRGSEITPRELGKVVHKEPRIKKLWLDFTQCAETYRVRMLEKILRYRFKDARLSDDFTELMDAGEDAHTGRIQRFWEQVCQKVDPDDAVSEWVRSGALKECVMRQSGVLRAAREYAVAHLRYLFTRRLNGEPVEDEKPGEAQTESEDSQ